MGRYSTQSSCSSATYMRRYCSIIWLRRSVCPSVCGCPAVERLSFVPSLDHKVCQNLAVKSLSLSVMNLSGMPKSDMIDLITMYASSGAVMVSLSGMNLVYLVNRSTITRIASHSCFVPGSMDFGSLTMKSIVTSLQGRFGAPCGCSKPYGLCLLILFRWHLSQLPTTSSMVFFMCDME